MKENFNKKKCERNNTHLINLQATIRSCGVSFDIWEKTTEDGKASGQYDFTRHKPTWHRQKEAIS